MAYLFFEASEEALNLFVAGLPISLKDKGSFYNFSGTTSILYVGGDPTLNYLIKQ